MEKDTIEANDLRFRQKVEALRTHLESRQRMYARKRKLGLRLTVLGSLVMVTAVGAYFLGNLAFRDQPAPVVTSAPIKEVSPAVEKRAIAIAPPEALVSVQHLTPVQETAAVFSPPAATEPPAAPIEKALPAVEAPVAAVERASSVAEVEVLIPAGEVEQASPAAEVEVPLSAAAVEPPVSAPAAPPPPVPRPVPSTTVSPETAVVARAEPTPPAPALPRADFRIAKSQACLHVEARQCVGPQDAFALHEHNVPHVWMTVYSENLPYVLTHVYYHEGQRYAEVPLAITYPRMRTWSNVTLQSPTHVGSWRVDIVTDDGTVIDQVAFRVTP